MARSTLLLAALLFGVSTIWAADPVLGTWTLNLGKSKYIPGPAPRSQTRVYGQDADGIKVTVVTVNPDGSSSTVLYPANYDAREHPVAGSRDTDGIVMKRVDDRTAESVLKHAGMTMGIARRTVSEDGRTMTITYQGESQGERVNNIGVYDKK
jgi:hypothetical protein